MKTELLYSILGDIGEERILAARRSFHPWLCAVAILLTAALTFGLSWVVDGFELDADRTETLYILPADQSHEALAGFLEDFETLSRSALYFSPQVEIGVHMPNGPIQGTDILFTPPAGVWAENSFALEKNRINRGRRIAGTWGWQEGDPKEALESGFLDTPIPEGRTVKVGESLYAVVGSYGTGVGGRVIALDAYLSEGLGTDCIMLDYNRLLSPSARSAVYRLARQHFGAGSQYFKDRPFHDRLAAPAMLALIVFLFCGGMALSYAAILRRREMLDRSPGKYALARADRVALRYAAWVFLGGLLGLTASGLTVAVPDAANILWAWLCPAALNGLLGWLLIRR